MRLVDLQLGFERSRIGNPRDVQTRSDLLPFLHGHLLQHSVGTGPYFQRIYLILLEFGQRAQLGDARLLRVKLCFG